MGLCLELDHLVLAAASLQQGVQHVAALLGLAPDAFSAEGKHALMGTHNRLLGLEGGAYLEVIAVDPSAPPPGRPRWFGLDDPTVQQRLADGPLLLHWVARVRPPADLTTLAQQQPEHVPPVVHMQRGSFRWRITVPADGSLPGGGDGVVPTLIQWDVEQTPAQLLAASGVRLLELRGRHPQPQRLAEELAALSADGLLVLDATAASQPGLTAVLETPSGLQTLT